MMSDFKRILAADKKKLRIFLLSVLILAGLFCMQTRGWSFCLNARVIVLILTVLVFPKLIYPMYVLSFSFAIVLSNLVITFLLGLLYWIAMVPIGILARRTDSRLLDIEIYKEDKTYWLPCEYLEGTEKQY